MAKTIEIELTDQQCDDIVKHVESLGQYIETDEDCQRHVQVIFNAALSDIAVNL